MITRMGEGGRERGREVRTEDREGGTEIKKGGREGD